MDATKLIVLGLVALAAVALVIIEAGKAIRKQKEKKEEKRRKEEELKKEAAVKANRRPIPALYRKTAPRFEEAYSEPPSNRTMILTYTTLLLKDCDHPVKVYKADLFQPVYIGRSIDNEICVRDPSVSRRHLRVFRDGALVYAENLSSVNGTYLNGRLMRETQEIVSGNRLKMGNVTLEVEID